MVSVKAIYKEGQFIPEGRSFPQGDNKHVIIIFPDEESKNQKNKSRKNFIQKWSGSLADSDILLSEERDERINSLKEKHQ